MILWRYLEIKIIIQDSAVFTICHLHNLVCLYTEVSVDKVGVDEVVLDEMGV